MGRVHGVAAEASPRHHYRERRFPFLHDTRLHRRSMSPHQLALRDIERVVAVAGGMVPRHIERVEIVVFLFELGAFFHGKAHVLENSDHLVADDGQRVVITDRRDGARDRNIRHAFLEARGAFLLLDLFGGLVDQFLYLILDLVRRLPDFLLLFYA